MIISCPNCKKKFNIDPTLIPEDGRDLKCGSCNHVWLYKVEDVSSLTLTLNENFDNNKIVTDDVEIKSDDKDKINQLATEKVSEKNEKNTKKYVEKQKSRLINNKGNTGSKFFSYLVVFIISFVALIILLDTLKVPLIDVFPGLEIILFSLFETLQDIKLFIIDLY